MIVQTELRLIDFQDIVLHIIMDVKAGLLFTCAALKHESYHHPYRKQNEIL